MSENSPIAFRAGGISELLLRAADPANQPIVGDVAREAVASLRGYAYQVYASALAWLDLPPGSELHLEVAEDFAIAAVDALSAVQVKNTQDTISLASKQARDAISAFVRLAQDNRGRAVKLTLLTTSTITTERNIDYRTGSVPGIERWRVAARGGNLADLREVLLRLDLSPDALAFIRERDDERLRRELIRRIEWRCGEGDLGELAARFEDRVAEVCFEEFGVPWAESPRHAAILLLHILRVCSRSGSRACTSEELRAILSSSTRVSTPRREYDAIVAALAGGLHEATVGIGVAAAWEAEGEIPLPRDLLPRTDLVGRIVSTLHETSIVVLHASSGMGKTALARLAVRAAGGSWNLLDLRNRSSDEAGEQLIHYARRQADGRHGLIAEDVPDVHLMDEGSRLVRAIGMVVDRGEPLILTSYRQPSAIGQLALGIADSSVFEIPVLTAEEIKGVVIRGGGDESWTHAVWLASRGGHPQLARALVAGLRRRGWPTEELGLLLTEGAPEIVEQLEATRGKLVRAIPDEVGRILLHRLGLVVGRFPRKVAIALGAVKPATPLPGEQFDTLIGPWIDQVGADRYRVSPLIVGSGDNVLPPHEVGAAHRAIAEALVADGWIDVDQIDNILLHGRAGSAAKPLLAIAHLIITSKPEKLASVAPLAPFLMSVDSSRPFLPTNPHLSLILRLAQTCLAMARGFGRDAKRTTQALIRELDAFNGKGKHDIEVIILGKLLFENGFSSNIIEWPYLLHRLLQGPVRRLRSLGSSEEAERHSIGPVLLSFNLSGLGSVVQLVDAFEKMSNIGEGRATLLGPMDGILAPTVVVLSPWLKERERGSADPKQAAEDYARLAEATRIWEQRDWSIALFVAAAEVRYQDLRDADAAFALLGRAEATLGGDPWLNRTRQKILWGERRDAEVLPIVADLQKAFCNNPIELIGSLREGAISASRLGNHALATEWLKIADLATADVSLISYRAVGIGLAADAATELWRGGNRREALESLSDVLARLGDLNSETSLQAGYVHRVVRHAMLWFADAVGMEAIKVEGDAPALPPGACSNPEPPAAILNQPLASLDISHYWLAQIAHAAGIPNAVPDPRTRLSGKPILIMEVSLRKDRLDHSILIGDPSAFMAALPPAMAALIGMRRLRERREGLGLNEWERGEFPPIDHNDPKIVSFIRDAVFSFRLKAMAEGRGQASDDLQGVLAERNVQSGVDTLSLLFPGPGKTGSRSEEACVSLVGRIDLGPADLLECCLRIGMRLERSEFLRLVGPYFVRWAKREWLRISEERRFSLRLPSVVAPVIAAAAQVEGESIHDLARLLDAVLPGVILIVPEDMRRWVRERASAAAGRSSATGPVGSSPH